MVLLQMLHQLNIENISYFIYHEVWLGNSFFNSVLQLKLPHFKFLVRMIGVFAVIDLLYALLLINNLYRSLTIFLIANISRYTFLLLICVLRFVVIKLLIIGSIQ